MIPKVMCIPMDMERSMGINTVIQRKGQLIMCTDTTMLAIRMVTSMDMSMVMVGIHIITVMQKKSQLLMFIVMDMDMDMVIHTTVAIPTVTIMVSTHMGILMDTHTMVHKKSCHSQNNLTSRQKKKSFLKKRFQHCKEKPTNITKI